MSMKRSQSDAAKKSVGQSKKRRHAGPRDSWDTPGIEDLGNFTYSVKTADKVKLYDCASLSQLFPAFAAAVTQFALELNMEPEGFVATVVHSFVWSTPSQKRHHVYTQIAGQAGFVEQTKYPRYLKNAVRGTWHSLGEEFSDDTEDESIEVIQLSDSDADADYDTT